MTWNKLRVANERMVQVGGPDFMMPVTGAPILK